MKLSRTFATLTVLAIVLLSGYSAVQAQDAEQIFEQLKSKYDSIESLRAKFTQTMTSEFTDQAEHSSGELLLKGKQYRVETTGQTLVTDGQVTWVYVPAEKQVLINDYVEDETTFNLNDFFLNYKDRYEVSDAKAVTYGGTPHHELVLTPKNPESFFTQVTLAVRDRDDIVTRLVVVDVNGTTMQFELKDIELNPRLDAKTFTFEPPQGVEVIDLRS